VAHYTKNKS